MFRDHKDVWIEKYEEALGDNLYNPTKAQEDAASKVAEEAVKDYHANLIDEAMDRAKYEDV
jgi:hypothetical protein